MENANKTRNKSNFKSENYGEIGDICKTAEL